MERAAISVVPPAGWLTMQLIGFSGYTAKAEDVIARIIVRNIAQAIPLFIDASPFLF
jgi:hypothetical protein